MEDDWNQSYQRIKAKHDEAYYAVEQAIQLEENGKPAQALAQYKLGIALIDDALITPVALPDDEDNTLDETWRQALKMIHKMKRSRADVVLRAGTLSNQLDPKDEASVRTEPNHSGVDGRPRTFSELGESLKNLQYNVDDIPNSLELLFLCDGVKLYHIAASGEVTTADESSTLRIVRLEKDIVQHLQATYFMQIIRSSVATPLVEESASDEENEDVAGAVGACSAGAAALATQNTPGRENSDSSLIYPLVPGASPCYLTDYGAFIFPDLESTVAGAAIGLLIPDESAEVALEILEAILHGVVKQARPNLAEWDDIPTGQYRPTRHISERISSGIVLGAGHISNGLVKGSEKVGEFVTYSTPYIISKLNRAPENAPPVSDCVINGVEMAKTATGVAVNVTGYIAGKVGSATMALGKFLAPHVQCQGSKLLTKTGMSADKAAETMGGVLTVAAGAVEGFGTVYKGLDQSASYLGTNLSNNSVKIIEHKYGPSAGNVAGETFDTVGNLINVNRNLKLFTPKGFAVRSAKNTGKALVLDYRPSGPRTNYVPAGDLYPDLRDFSNKPKI